MSITLTGLEFFAIVLWFTLLGYAIGLYVGDSLNERKRDRRGRYQHR